MKRILAISVAVALCASVAQAAVVDDFEATWTDNYTRIDSASNGSLTSTTTGNAGQAPWAGLRLGDADSPGQEASFWLWDGPAQVDNGDSVSVMAYIPGGSGGSFYGATGLVVKQLSSTNHAYIVNLWGYGNEAGFSVGCKDMDANTRGTPAKNWSTGKYLGVSDNHNNATSNSSFGNVLTTGGGWYRIEATYTESGTTNTVVAKVYNSSNVQVGVTKTYTDSGSAASQGAGDFGFFGMEWGDAGYKDGGVDDLSYVPEPASLALLGVGGVLALIRRRKR